MYFYLNKDYDTPDRFDFARLHEYNDAGLFDVTNSHFVDSLMKLPVSGKYVVSNGEEGRADILSHQIYGNVGLWWVLLKYNGLRSPFEIKSGMTIYYPRLPSLDDELVNIQSNAIVDRTETITTDPIIQQELEPSINLTTYFAGYLIITPAEVNVAVLPDIYVNVAKPSELDFTNLPDWPQAHWTDATGTASAQTVSTGFEKVYFAIPVDEFDSISIFNSQSDVGGGWNTYTQDVEFTSGTRSFIIYESVNNNLGTVNWLLNLTMNNETE